MLESCFGRSEPEFVTAETRRPRRSAREGSLSSLPQRLVCRVFALLALTLAGLLASVPEVLAHRLPGFPQIRLLGTEPDPADPLARFVTVHVLDPAGRQPVSGAEVTARALHGERGSALRTEPVQLAPGGESGIYRGRLGFPRAGPWQVTIEVQGRYVGDAHFTMEIAAPATVGAQGQREARKPDLPIDWLTVRHLSMEWGHILGFGLWVAVTLSGLINPTSARWVVVLGTWAAFAIEGVTGLYKMEYSTPFPGSLPLLAIGRIPRIFFAREYVYTLVVKHVLMLVGMALTVGLTVHVWRTKPGDGIRVFRGLLSVNLVLSLLIAGAAAILGLYHAIVLHFS